MEVVIPHAGDGCLIWPFCRPASGYGSITINGVPQPVHRLVCEIVHGPAPTPEHEAAHSCGRGADGCVNPQHLRWATHAENCADMVAHGTSTRGERNPQAKLTEPEVRQILALKGRKTQREIAEMFGTTRTNVGHIHRGVSWSWMGAA